MGALPLPQVIIRGPRRETWTPVLMPRLVAESRGAQGNSYDARPLLKSLYSKPVSGCRFWGCKDGGAAPPPAWDPG